jgi:hypothetical protein
VAVTVDETLTDIRVLTPRIRRALEGTGAPVLTDDQIKDITADAMADVTLYLGSVFGKQLVVTETDANGAPIEYATTEELSLQEGSVIAAQAALDYFFFQFAGMKVSETISDEASSWEYALSPSLLANQLKLLQQERDKALEALAGNMDPLEHFMDFVYARDAVTARMIEPWVLNQGVGGQAGFFDERFGTY